MADNSKVTILEIAERANVSPSTVSRVLRGTAGVAEGKREAVLQAVNELDYRPNVFAQSLASGQSMTLGVLTQNFGSPFYDGILQGILQGLDGSDYSPIFADGRWQTAVEQRALQMLLDRRVDGLIVIGGQIPEEKLQKIVGKTPFVAVARKLHTLPDHCLYVDNFAAAYEATRYLIAQGHREIAHITAAMHYQAAIDDVRQRYEGYVQALQDAHITPDSQLVVEGNLLQQSGVLAIETLLLRGRPFSAIFTANDQMAFGARLGLYRRGIRVPEDVSLVGFDDEASAAYFIPPLTTVRQPARALGQTAACAILDMIDGKDVELPVLTADLVIRETVARHL
ncbi:MAG: LacI family DNA-binding transcriptional regulator [Ardenticatenaceae bacterium]|nr:LacI family DNA-binding transcriptional regulator [Ardenticatenaceae bacterium]